MKSKPYLPGDQVGAWTLVRFAGRNRQQQRLWQCRCACGILRDVQEYKLRSHNTYSCGCQPRRF